MYIVVCRLYVLYCEEVYDAASQGPEGAEGARGYINRDHMYKNVIKQIYGHEPIFESEVRS
jgi:hypothetical protein